jgi:hypothetical protein
MHQHKDKQFPKKHKDKQNANNIQEAGTVDHLGAQSERGGVQFEAIRETNTQEGRILHRSLHQEIHRLEPSSSHT